MGTCGGCGTRVPVNAIACPGCGEKFKKKSGRGLIFIAISVAAVAAFISFSSGPTPADTSKASDTAQATRHDAEANSDIARMSSVPVPISDSDLAKAKSELKKTLALKRDEIEKTSFYSPKHPISGNSGVEAYIAISDGRQPVLRMRSIYYGDRWVFYKKIKVLADNNIIYDRSFTRGEISRDNAGGSVWEVTDYIASADDIAAMQAIANARSTVIRFDGDDRQHDHKVTKQEAANLAVVIGAFKTLSK